MNIVVCAKQVVDVSEIKVDSKTNKPILAGVPQKISDIDKNAMEEAIKIKEKHSGKLTVVTVGPADAKEKIKELLAMGADEGIHIVQPEKLDYFVVSTILAGAIKKIGDMILFYVARHPSIFSLGKSVHESLVFLIFRRLPMLKTSLLRKIRLFLRGTLVIRQ